MEDELGLNEHIQKTRLQKAVRVIGVAALIAAATGPADHFNLFDGPGEWRAVGSAIGGPAWAAETGLASGGAFVGKAVYRVGKVQFDKLRGTTPGEPAPEAAPGVSTSPSPVPSSTKSANPKQQMTAAECIAKMPVEQRVGQVLAPGLQGDSLKAASRSLKSHYIGSILVMSSPTNLKDITKVKESQHIRPLIVTDAEGGIVNRFPQLGSLPSQEEMAKMPANKVMTMVAANAAELKNKADIDQVLGPVIDRAQGNNPLGAAHRVFSSDQKRIKVYADAVAAGWESSGIIPTYKHVFTMKEHTDFKVSDTYPIEQLRKNDMYPVMNLPASRAEMVSSASVPGLTKPGQPATLSEAAITGELRGKMGFKGVITSDDLAAPGMGGKPVAEAATEFIAAGGSQAVVVIEPDPNVAFDAKQADRELTKITSYMVKSVGTALPEEKLNAAVGHIFDARNQYADARGYQRLNPCDYAAA